MSGLSFAIQRSKQKAISILADVERVPETFVDVKSLAEKYGVRVRDDFEFKDPSVSGFLYRSEDGKTFIAVNSNHLPARQRFTIAHELGHFFLHSNERVHVDEHETVSAMIHFRDEESSKATRINEIEANGFAAELLMPSEEVFAFAKREMAKKRLMEDIIEELAKTYKVSITAMSFKLGQSIS